MRAIKDRPFAQDFSGETPTQQQFKEQCDVNTIVRQRTETGLDPYAERLQSGSFGFNSSISFSEALRNVREVENAFNDQPSAVRSEFKNDPSAWLDALQGQNLEGDQGSPEIVAPDDAQELSETVVDNTAAPDAQTEPPST